MAALFTVLRVAGYAGFVLWAGPLIFWTLVWPTGHRHRRLLRLSGVGAVLLILTSIAEPAIRLTAGGQPLDDVAPPLAGAAVLLRLAILVGSLFYLVDLVSGAVVGSRRAGRPGRHRGRRGHGGGPADGPRSARSPAGRPGYDRPPAGDRRVAGWAGRSGGGRPARCRARRRRRGRRAGDPLLARGHARTGAAGGRQRPHRAGRDLGPRRRAPGVGAGAPLRAARRPPRGGLVRPSGHGSAGLPPPLQPARGHRAGAGPDPDAGGRDRAGHRLRRAERGGPGRAHPEVSVARRRRQAGRSRSARVAATAR